MASDLNQQQILQDCHDITTHSLKVEIGSNTGIDIQLDSSVDSITSVPTNTAQKASITSANSAIILGPFPVIGMTTLNIYSNTTSTLTGAQVCTLQLSPSDSDNVWLSTSCTLTESTTSGTVVAGTAITGQAARRARVVIAAAISTGGFDIYCNASGT